jgi:BirA family transcriptional regulator, biotin operon repressor / biotin---[acetyl-CoA-carboxylase] ligase
MSRPGHWPDGVCARERDVSVLTSDERFASRLLGRTFDWDAGLAPGVPPELVRGIFDDRPLVHALLPTGLRWVRSILAVSEAPRSHMDVLSDLGRQGEQVPSGTLLVAERGRGFHGQHARPWTAAAGNLHLSALFRPDIALDTAVATVAALPVVAVVNAIDAMSELAGRARIKWVNDVLLDGAKVAGVLCSTKLQGTRLTELTLGIGLNVEAEPDVEPTVFVPRVGSLKRHAPTATLGAAFGHVCAALDHAMSLLAEHGPEPLLEVYRRRSLALGRVVEVWPDDAASPPSDVVTGTVTAIGDQLELVLDNGRYAAFSGRMRMVEP